MPLVYLAHTWRSCSLFLLFSFCFRHRISPCSPGWLQPPSTLTSVSSEPEINRTLRLCSAGARVLAEVSPTIALFLMANEVKDVAKEYEEDAVYVCRTLLSPSLHPSYVQSLRYSLKGWPQAVKLPCPLTLNGCCFGHGTHQERTKFACWVYIFALKSLWEKQTSKNCVNTVSSGWSRSSLVSQWTCESETDVSGM